MSGGAEDFAVLAHVQLLEGFAGRAEVFARVEFFGLVVEDLADGGGRRGERWREELIAKSIARSFAGASQTMTEEGAVRLVEELCSCQMPYVCPRGKPVMIFTSTRELDRKFAR